MSAREVKVAGRLVDTGNEMEMVAGGITVASARPHRDGWMVCSSNAGPIRRLSRQDAKQLLIFRLVLGGAR